jgi:bacteriocin-like protein
LACDGGHTAAKDRVVATIDRRPRVADRVPWSTTIARHSPCTKEWREGTMNFETIATHELNTITGGQFPINNQIPTLIGPPSQAPSNPAPKQPSTSSSFSSTASAVFSWIGRHLFGQ